MPVVNVNGVRLNYSQITCDNNQNCEDLVMIHGLATNLAFWGLHFASIFSKRYRVTLYDLRGHGRSEVTDCGYTPDNLAIDLQMLLDHLGIKKAHIVAHSFGGVIALKLACLYPDRISSLILADTQIAAIRNILKNHTWKFGERIKPILIKNNLASNINHPYFGYQLLTELARMQIIDNNLSPDLKTLLFHFKGQFGDRTAVRWLKLMNTTNAEKELMNDDKLSIQDLKKIKFPILAVYGENSQALLTGKSMLDVWPNADFRCVRDAGHFFPISRSGEFMNYCKQFWHGALVGNYPRRNGDPVKSHFRRDRLYLKDKGWFFSTREQLEVGPFADIEDAGRALQMHIATVTMAEVF